MGEGSITVYQGEGVNAQSSRIEGLVYVDPLRQQGLHVLLIDHVDLDLSVIPVLELC